MTLDAAYVTRGFVLGIVFIIIVQVIIDRLARRLNISDTWSVAVFSTLATIYIALIPHIYYFGRLPFPNLITIPGCVFMLMTVLLCVACFPDTSATVEPSLSSSTDPKRFSAYFRARIPWAYRTALLAMTTAFIRSGSAPAYTPP